MNMPNRPSPTFGDNKVKITTDPISPNSTKIYENGIIHKDLRVPFREVSQAPTQVTEKW